MNRQNKPARPISRWIPSWLINLLGFGLLITLVLAAFLYQMRDVNRSLQKNVLARTRMVAAIIEDNLANATLALNTVDRLVTTFLQDKLDFIAYLEGIDPLQPEELTALARETGLLGISLWRADATEISGPADWLPETTSCKDMTESLHYQGKSILLAKDFSQTSETLTCVLIGLDGTTIVDLRKKSSLSTLLNSFADLPGIHSVDLVNPTQADTTTTVALVTANDRAIAQSRVPTDLGTLVVNLDAKQFLKRRDRVRRQFFLFAAVLMFLGLFFSWLLYRFQQNNLHQVRTFEQLLASEHEAAALGRTTATIAHEIRNPLNAINMGLQRLRLESNNLDEEQEELIGAMNEAVQRTSAIVAELQRFTRPLQPVLIDIDLNKQLRKILTLYAMPMQQQQIDLSVQYAESVQLLADKNLINELLENLIKNAVEAQPKGGAIDLTVTDLGDAVALQMDNKGFTLEPSESSRLGEPYFTTKTRGTGLGLALCRRIVKAHDGELHILPGHTNHSLTIRFILPKKLAE